MVLQFLVIWLHSFFVGMVVEYEPRVGVWLHRQSWIWNVLLSLRVEIGCPNLPTIGGINSHSCLYNHTEGACSYLTVRSRAWITVTGCSTHPNSPSSDTNRVCLSRGSGIARGSHTIPRLAVTCVLTEIDPTKVFRGGRRGCARVLDNIYGVVIDIDTIVVSRRGVYCLPVRWDRRIVMGDLQRH